MTSGSDSIPYLHDYLMNDEDNSGDEDSDNRQSNQNYMLREQDRFLPICNIIKIMKVPVPENGKIAKDARECIQECVSEFISFITSEAIERSMSENRKTVNGDDLLYAFSNLGFDNYVEPLSIYLHKFREATKCDRNLFNDNSAFQDDSSGDIRCNGSNQQQHSNAAASNNNCNDSETASSRNSHVLFHSGANSGSNGLESADINYKQSIKQFQNYLSDSNTTFCVNNTLTTTTNVPTTTTAFITNNLSSISTVRQLPIITTVANDPNSRFNSSTDDTLIFDADDLMQQLLEQQQQQSSTNITINKVRRTDFKF
uniref:Transcription factor CBF/NF-Y/archaeal histone domain-containing protein n=1 Tax=Glossina morsitans morsitans TaxID=37546 RepID=A0A1B0FIP7_GLOMM